MQGDPAFPPALRRTSRISWAPSAQFIEFALDAPATSFNYITCPDDFYAVRVGYANVSKTSYTVLRAIAAPSTTPGDLANPTGDAAWRSFTFANGGADVDSLVNDAGAPAEIVVAAGEHGPMMPRWTWSDWAPLASLPRTDAPAGARILMVRTLLAGGATVTQPAGNFSGYFNENAVNHGFEYGAGWVPADYVTGPDRILDNVAAASFGEARSTVACIQFATKNRGLVGMVAGDGQHQGTSTTTQFLNYLLRATTLLGSAWIGKIPFGYVSTAVGGATSEQFFTMFLNLLPAIRPAFAVLPGWTYNDQGEDRADQRAADVFMARLIHAADSCIMHGTVPIFLTPFPRDAGSMTPVQVAPWLKLRDAILSMRAAGASVVDATAILGARDAAGAFSGMYQPEYSTDGVHPNDAGHAAVAYALTIEINRLADIAGVKKKSQVA